ncbi:MAG: transglycosylase SLT domain-containing protein [Leptospiraceae bacterium]|nr:transglycosylase SLT domain-containing protein [Leptospiraceae bacterium]
MHKVNFIIFIFASVVTSIFSAPTTSSDHITNFNAKIEERCAIYGCQKAVVQFIMMCESRGNPKALNNIGPYKGLFQFTDDTFQSFSIQAGLKNADIWNPYHQIEAAAWAFANGKGSHWYNCYNKALNNQG